MEKNNQHSFTIGFTCGLFAGLAGYYLFGTNEGKKTRTKITKEWEKAHQYLVDEGVLGDQAEFKNLGDFLVSARDELFKKIDLEVETDDKSHKKRTYTRHKKQKQFKGV